MLLGTNRVWDYAGDNFVHRLLQNKGDGKLVEAEQPSKEPVSNKKKTKKMYCNFLKKENLFFREWMKKWSRFN